MGTTAAALWDILAKAANLAQMSGLHAVMLVAVIVTVLRIPQSKRECVKLERCTRRLRALLQWPATVYGVALLCSDMVGDPVGEALADAAGLVESYKKSTLWRRVRSGRGMATQLRDMQDVVNSYYGLLLCINAHLLTPATHRPASDTTTTIPEVDEPSQNPSVEAVTSCPTTTGGCDTQKANDIGRGGTDSQTGNPSTQPTRLVVKESCLPICHSDFPSITVQGGD